MEIIINRRKMIMNKEQKSYLKSCKQWIEGAEISAKQLAKDHEYNMEEINLHKQHAKLCRKRLKHTIESIVEQKKTVIDYCKSEGLAIPE